MALPESDIEIHVVAGGFLLSFDMREAQGKPWAHVCTSERELVTLILDRIQDIRDTKASDAAERALKDKQ